MLNVKQAVAYAIEGLRITTSTQEVEITGWLQSDLIAMQKEMLKANPCLVFDIVELPGQTFLLIYFDRKSTFVSNVVQVDFKNKMIVSHGRVNDRRGKVA